MKRDLSGILLVDKPIGLSSNQVLQKVKYLYQAKKAGHTGSLDPLATGMLPICFGQATKFSQYLLDGDKTYEACICLGANTTTGDKEGDIIEQRDVPEISQQKIEQTLRDFIGVISQVPPMYSALKHQGKPLYHYARKGEVIERKPREITIFSLELLSLDLPHVTVRVHCSKGTYIRTLAQDIGETLNVGAHLSALRRTGAAPYNNLAMYPLDELLGNEPDDSLLLPADSAISTWPEFTLDEEQVRILFYGQPLTLPISGDIEVGMRLYDKGNKFLGVAFIDQSGLIVKRRLFNPESNS
jgi:tRNA pseudouridine55 synthase